jgi:uncharacterized lipoprotein YmbA
MKSLAISTFAFSALLLTGCASQGTAYYTLSVPQSEASMASATKDVAPYIVSRVSVPAAVDDTPLIVRQSNDQLMVLTDDKWTAPLGEIMRGALSQSLTQIIGMPPIQGVMQQTLPRPAGTSEVVVDIQQFDLEPAKRASIGAVWRVSFNDKGNRALTCYSLLSAPAAPGVVPLVAAQQKNVTSLAQQIAFVLQNQRAPDGINCQLTG